jgi:serine beta-lactamase-like protein LACTB, mitochondrial
MPMSLRFCRFAWWLTISLVAAGGCASPARVAKPAVVAALSADEIARIDGAVRAEMGRQQLVGVAGGVIRDGEIAYLQGYGLADREHHRSMTTASVVNWASNSKPMAAVMAMQLVDEKRLDIDADGRTYVPEFPDKGVKITPRLLMCHESGMVHYKNGKVVGTERRYATAEPFRDPALALDVFNQSPLLFTPGAKTSYSTYGYILLSAVIQRAGGEAYDEQIQRRIAEPLGMKSLQLDAAKTDAPEWSAEYTRVLGAVIRAPEEANDWKHGGGGFKSDIADFAKWAQALARHRLVSAAAEKTMWTRQRLNGGELTEWGLGFGVRPAADGLTISHGGQQDEATSHMSIVPAKGAGLVILCNCGFADMKALVGSVKGAMAREQPMSNP